MQLIRWKLGIFSLILILTLFTNATLVQANANRTQRVQTGTYEGFFYISAIATYNYDNNRADPSYKGTGSRDYDLHGSMFCEITDEEGNGTCIISFPMTELWAANATISGSNCHATITENARSLPTPYVFKTDVIRWTGPFSMDFAPKPRKVQGHANSQVSGQCGKSQAIAFTFNAKEPEWPTIDSRKLGGGLSNAMAGKCTMAGLPRNMTISGPSGSTMTAKLELRYCGWGITYVNPDVDPDIFLH